MTQIILNSKETDLTKKMGRQKALQIIADSPVCNETLRLLAEWVQIPGAEEKLLKNKTKIKIALSV